MNSKEIEAATLKDDNISSTDEEDKKFVSQAVAFVIGHTRNGFVALCASVATLLKEQARLKRENETLKQRIVQLEHEAVSACPKEDGGVRKLAPSNEESNFRLSIKRGKVSSFTSQQNRFTRKDYYGRCFKALKDCLCESCIGQVGTRTLSTPLTKGNRVVISGEICGTVCYVGHVESLSFPEIYIGLHLDEAVGDSNGSIGRKTYFTAPQGYGLFVPMLNVCCIIN